MFCVHEAEYEKKIDECKQKTKKVKSKAHGYAEIELLQKELQAEIEKEHLLKEDLR